MQLPYGCYEKAHLIERLQKETGAPAKLCNIALGRTEIQSLWGRHFDYEKAKKLVVYMEMSSVEMAEKFIQLEDDIHQLQIKIKEMEK